MKDSERQGFFMTGVGLGIFLFSHHDILQFEKSSFCTLWHVIFFTRRRGNVRAKLV